MSENPFAEEVRRAAPELWLSSRLAATAESRRRLVCLHAVTLEIARAAAVAAPLAGEIRLAWWREEVEALRSGTRPPGHGALLALAPSGPTVAPELLAVIEGREGELETRPFADETALERYLDAVDGGALRAGAALLIPGPAPPLTHLARALGLARLLKERDAWLQRGRDWTPAAWSQASEAEIVEHARHRLLEALGRARVEVRALPVEAFAAAAPGALLASFARGRRPKGLELRLRLLLASLRGAV